MTKKKDSAEKAIRDIRRATRRRYSAEEKIRIVLEGLRGESSIAELCRQEGINQILYYRWSKEFLEVGNKRLAGDTAREANSDEVKAILGHSDPSVTARYSHLSTKALQEASDSAADAIKGALRKSA
jgi:transposase